MTSGKLDEVLARISTITDAITSNALLLFNELFASASELEDTEVARQSAAALRERGICVCLVTHLYAFAHDRFGGRADTCSCVRNGARTARGRSSADKHGHYVAARRR